MLIVAIVCHYVAIGHVASIVNPPSQRPCTLALPEAASWCTALHFGLNCNIGNCNTIENCNIGNCSTIEIVT